VAAGVTAAADVLRSEGADVRDVTLPGAEDAGLAGDTIMAVEASAYHLAWLRQRPDDYGEDVRARLTLGLTVPGVSYANALRLRTAARAEALTLLTEVDALLAPATPITAPPIDGFGVEQRMRLKRFTTPVNTLGLPALSLPCGFDGAGLPIGMQLIGRPFEEALLLRAGRAYERVAGWVGRRPEL
jgi:aspartyl-tRNA(Asn)/glutamyl-tRNA(Gln) amidotransferase subunit A